MPTSDLSPLRSNRSYLDGTLSSPDGGYQQHQSPPSNINNTGLKGYGSSPTPTTHHHHQQHSTYADGLASSPSGLTPRGHGPRGGVTQGSTDATGAVSQALKHIRQLRMQRTQQQIVAAAGSPLSGPAAAVHNNTGTEDASHNRLAVSTRFAHRDKTRGAQSAANTAAPSQLNNKYLLQVDGTNLPDGDHTTFLTDTDDDVDEQRASAAVQANQGIGKSIAESHKEDDERRLPNSVLADGGLSTEILDADAGRVVPQFIKALTSFSAARQRLHIKLFDEHLSTFLEVDDTTPSEWEMLLTLLFVLARRRGGLSVLQRRYHGEISNLCLGLLCRLLSAPEDNPRFPEVLTALNSIMYKVGCTKEDDLIDAFFTRPDAVAGLSEEAMRLQDVSKTLPDWGTDDDVDSSDEDLPEVETRYQQQQSKQHQQALSSINTTTLLPPADAVATTAANDGVEVPRTQTGVESENASPAVERRIRPWDWISFNACIPSEARATPCTLAHPLHYSLDVLSADERGELTEEDFLTLEHWFRQLPDHRPATASASLSATAAGSGVMNNNSLGGSTSASPTHHNNTNRSSPIPTLNAGLLGEEPSSRPGSVIPQPNTTSFSLIDHNKIVAPALKQISSEAGRGVTVATGRLTMGGTSNSYSRASMVVGPRSQQSWLGVGGEGLVRVVTTTSTTAAAPSTTVQSAVDEQHQQSANNADSSTLLLNTTATTNPMGLSRPTTVGGGFLGSRFITDRIARTFAAAFNPTGACSFFQLLQFLFPLCPEKTLLKRCQGVPLGDELISMADLIVAGGRVDNFIRKEKEKHLMRIPGMTLDKAQEMIKSGAALPPAPVVGRASTDALLSESGRQVGDDEAPRPDSPNPKKAPAARRKSLSVVSSDMPKRKTSSAGKRPPRSPSLTSGGSVQGVPSMSASAASPAIVSQPFHLDDDSLQLLRHILEDERGALVSAPPVGATPESAYVEPSLHKVHRRLRLLQRTDWGSGGLEAELELHSVSRPDEHAVADDIAEQMIVDEEEAAAADADPLRRELAAALKAENLANKMSKCHNPLLLQPITLTVPLAAELYRWFRLVDWCNEGVILVGQMLALAERNQCATANRLHQHLEGGVLSSFMGSDSTAPGSISASPTNNNNNTNNSTSTGHHQFETTSQRVQKSRNLGGSHVDGINNAEHQNQLPTGFFIGDWRLEIEALLQYKQGAVSHSWRQQKSVALETSPLERSRGGAMRNGSPNRSHPRNTHPADLPASVSFTFEEIMDYLFTDHTAPTVDGFVSSTNESPKRNTNNDVVNDDVLHYPVHLASQLTSTVFKQPFQRIPKESVRDILRVVREADEEAALKRKEVAEAHNATYREKLRDHLNSAHGTATSRAATPSSPAPSPAKTGRVSMSAGKRPSSSASSPPPIVVHPPVHREPTREDIQVQILEHLQYPSETHPIIQSFVSFHPAGDMSLSMYAPPAPYGSEAGAPPSRSGAGGRLGAAITPTHQTPPQLPSGAVSIANDSMPFVGGGIGDTPFDSYDGNAMLRTASFFNTLDPYLSTTVMEWAETVCGAGGSVEDVEDAVKAALSSLPLTTPLHPHYMMRLLHLVLKREGLKSVVAKRRADVKIYRLGCRREAAALAIRKQLAYNLKSEQEHVQVAFGPSPPESAINLYGFNLTPAVFDISTTFLRKPERRPQLQRLISVLDLSGVPARWFVHNPALLQRVLPHNRPKGLLFTSPVHCYRDFAMCSQRPSLSTYLKSRNVPLTMAELAQAEINGTSTNFSIDTVSHKIQVRTNIPVSSAMKYRFAFEGYNFGVNAPVNSVVVGATDHKLSRVGDFEYYGWPEGWDKQTTIHLERGIEAISCYAGKPSQSSSSSPSQQNVVCFELSAKSFARVGFSVSAWFMAQGFGGRHEPYVQFVHQDARLV